MCKRRGFIFPSSEIYGGFGSGYDFGPLGVELKNNIKRAWWDEMTKKQNLPNGEIIGLDAGILMSPKVWEASGHLTAGFADELVECKKCHKRFKMDEIEIKKCPECGGELTKPKKFNLMMKTFVGPVEDESSTTYLRPETCQGIYVNFLNVMETMRLKIPFGIAQIGKAFRNEITPKDFIFRTREFEQMEMQYFVASPQSKSQIPNPKSQTNPKFNLPASATPKALQAGIQNPKLKTPDDWFNYWKEQRLNWYADLGLKKENIRTIEVPKQDRAHYAQRQIDIEYKFPFGWKEIEGVHNRGDYDLSNHTKHSGKELNYFDPSANSGQDEQSGEKHIPFVIETSVGVERILLAFLCDAYTEIKGARTKTTQAVKETETVLKLDRRLAPIKVAVLPLVKNKPELVKKAKQVYQLLKPRFTCQYDETGSIGRRYRRQDEIGTIATITIDFDTLKDNTVTSRNRDTMKQERVKIENLVETINKKLS